MPFFKLLSSIIIILLAGTEALADITIVGDLTHEKLVEPGKTYEGEIVIKNDGSSAEDVKIYQTDYLFYSNGSSEYGKPESIERSNAGWIALNPRRLRMLPGETKGMKYIIKVPDSANLKGSYWSIIMVEAVPKIDPDSLKNKGFRINTLLRYGVQVITHLGDTGERSLKFTSAELKEDAGKRILEVDLENCGERLLRPNLWVEIYSEKGEHIGNYQGGKLRTYPGTSIRYRIDLTQVPGGSYKSLVVADCGGEDLFGIQYTLQIQ